MKVGWIWERRMYVNGYSNFGGWKKKTKGFCGYIFIYVIYEYFCVFKKINKISLKILFILKISLLTKVDIQNNQKPSFLISL